MTPTLTNTVGDWVTQYPQTSRVFESLQIDYCCGGKTPLEAACRERGLDTSHVLEQLQHAIGSVPDSTEDWPTASLTALCDNIEQTHHTYLKSELPRLSEIITKVCNAHGDSHPELSRLADVFQSLRNELEPHMLKEEQVLFPAIRQLEAADGEASFPFGSVANPIRMMEQEHDNAGDGLSRIRKITNDFAVPEDACNTYIAMLDGLRELETDLHQHIHKENNILFPRSLAIGK